MKVQYLWQLVALISLLFCFGRAFEASEWPENDLVKSIPGYDGELNNRWWAGYVNVTIPSKPLNKLYYHYALVEADEEAHDKPLLLWTNGGPGASSLWGLFTEIGPYWLTEESLKTEFFEQTGIPSLMNSTTSWTKFANLLIMNGPPPVAFSYCEQGGPNGDGYSCGDWDDELTAEANFHFLEGFFAKFPVFKERKTEFYLTGESYAGIYIPTLTEKILENKHTTSYELLKGIAIGDGCIGSDLICSAITSKMNIIEQKFSAQFLFGHGQVPTALYEHYVNTCNTHFKQVEKFLKNQINRKDNFRKQRELLTEIVNPSSECVDIYNRIREVVSFFNVYNLYDECWKAPNVPMLEEEERRLLSDTMIYEPYPCGGSVALSKYVLSEKVKKAFNVPKEARHFSGDNGGGMNYKATVKNLIPWHYSIAMDSKLRVLIYNGDTDHDLNAFFSEWWVDALTLRRLEDWRAWTLDGGKEVVGYTMKYEGDYTYATIRGSGHMVPTMKPKAAFELVRSWVGKMPLKKAEKTSSHVYL